MSVYISVNIIQAAFILVVMMAFSAIVGMKYTIKRVHKIVIATYREVEIYDIEATRNLYHINTFIGMRNAIYRMFIDLESL
jgi:hypothetical protein